MKITRHCAAVKVITFCLLGAVHFSACASNNPQEQADITIKTLYHSMSNKPNSDMATRIDTISSQFLGKPYKLGALGEGQGGRFDQSPLYRTDSFDCETLVTTVLAMALAENEKTFRNCQLKLRYDHGKPSFIHRNHFTDLDWNLNNQRQGFLKDITNSITSVQNKPVAKIASALIDKPAWYQHFNLTNIKLQNASPSDQKQRLDELKKRGSHLSSVQTNLAYLPLTALFNDKGEANTHLFAQIPNASIIEIVRPNWNLREQIGTCLNISHLGFAFWKNNTLIFRQASSQYGKVVDVSLIDYLKEARSSPTIKGINVQIVLPKKPLTNGCHVRS